ncbi:MAG: DNA polymerase III subunit gamma/tau [Acidobacteria bacterium]|nr:DNA polymerase III subunit gamma/tau [Acidobacteriota bacterium]
MTYQVLARRWRPQRFDDLVGQEVVVRSLRNALSSGQVAHAYLFSGLRGVGKTTVARLLAKALNCEKGPTADPCGVCATCVEIAAGSALDVLEMDAASNRGIDDVRELREVARVLPVRDRYRVFIVDEAHQLTDAAFNALLKILEEPPAHVVFILASTEKDKFPATILSRCQQLDFRPIPGDVIIARLQKIAAEEGFALTPGAARLVARATEGSLRDALSLLDRVRAFADAGIDEAAVTEVLGLPPQEVLLSLWDALAAGDAPRALGIVREEERLGRDTAALYAELVQLLDALLLLACDGAAPVAYAEEHRATLRASAEEVGVPLLLRLVGLALEQRAMIATADRPGLAVAVAIGRLALWPRLRRVEELLAAGGAGSTGSAPAPVAPRRSPAAGHGTPPAGNSPAIAAPTAGAAPTAQGRLGTALDDAGAHLLAGRVRAAKDVVVEGSTLVLRFPGAPAATLASLRDSLGELTAAARAAGLPDEVRVEGNGDNGQPAAPGLRQRVEADPRVQRVVGVFGGRIEKVEEKA